MNDESPVSQPDEAVMDAGMEMLLDLASPQPGYLRAIAEGGCAQPMEGLTDRVQSRAERVRPAASRAVLVGGRHRSRQHPAAHPAQRRPARALEVPQDPRPAVRAEAHGRAGGRHHRTRQLLHRRVRRPRRVRLHRGVRRAAPVVGVPRADGPAVGGARLAPASARRHSPPAQDRSRTRCSTPTRAWQ